MPLSNILDFDPSTFAVVLSNEYTSTSEIQNKAHFKYLLKYLGPDCLNAKKLVVENDYISRDYLHDYAAYIAFSFKKYPKFCKRIHIFASEFSELEFDQQLLNSQVTDESSFWNSYLGFIVVKPIPSTVVGYTLLRRSTEVKNAFSTKLLRHYPVHLYGRKLLVNSLAFQEQDSVLSACATTAIWIMLSKAAATDYAQLKSPSQITKDAGLVKTYNRLFPNREGLKFAQLVHAIRESGLEAEITSGDANMPNSEYGDGNKYVSHSIIKRLVSAYSTLGVPVLLIKRIKFTNKVGHHAVAVSGYSYGDTDDNLKSDTFGLKADSIKELYVHDDQIGPYAKIWFPNVEHEVESGWKEYRNAISTNIISVVVPTFPKVRITYSEIEYLVKDLNFIVKGVIQLDNERTAVKPQCWDIALQLSEDYKRQLHGYPIDDENKLRLLKASMPKYIWVTSFYFGDKKLMEFIFDATDIGNSMIAEHAVSFLDADTIPKMRLQELKILYEKKQSEMLHFTQKYFEWFLDYFDKHFLLN